MKTSRSMKSSTVQLFPFLLLALVFSGIAQPAAQIPKQQTFQSAEDAVVALVDALKANDVNTLVKILGAEAREIISSDDSVADQRGRDLFIAAYHQRSVLEGDEKTKTLDIGGEGWPFPIPLVKEGAGWRFDTAAGIEELRNRRIGRNELATISACQAYVDAQKEYAQKGHDGKPAGLYAQKAASDPGKQNGLYWQVKPGEEESPLGELVVEAVAEGYTRTAGKSTPFRGYYFHLLTAQGPSAQGGAKPYVVDGEMRNGFALVAFPAEYGKSGVMTFIVDQSGIVYEKDLGEETAKLAGEIKTFNPDNSWQRTASQEK
jgi:hypothetical protein